MQANPTGASYKFHGLPLDLAQVLLAPRATLSPAAARQTSPFALINCRLQSCKTAPGLFDLFIRISRLAKVKGRH